MFENFIHKCFFKDVDVNGNIICRLNENHPDCDLETFEAMMEEGYLEETDEGYFLKPEYVKEYFKD